MTDTMTDQNRDNIMIDAETMGTGPRAAVVAIGAVRFGPKGLGDSFYHRIDLASAMAAGLTVDADTIRWWMRQGAEARDEIAGKPGDDLREVLYHFERWMLMEGGEPLIWANGAVSDPVWLCSAYEACGFPVPWKHWQVRCFRTLRALLPWVPGPPKPDTPHHALQDAAYQATHAGALLRELERLQPPAVVWPAVESHEAPCAACGDTGTAAELDGAGGWRPVACGCWLGRAGVAAADAIRRVPIFPGGPPIMAAPCEAAGPHLSVLDSNLRSVNNSPAATEANESAETAAGLNGESAAPCAAAPGESVLTTGVSSLPREFWLPDSAAHGG